MFKVDQFDNVIKLLNDYNLIDTYIKDYIQIKKLEMQQSMISKELDLLNAEISDEMIKNNEKIKSDLEINTLEDRFEQSQKDEATLVNKISNGSNTSNSFNLEEAKNNKNYLWKSKYVNNYQFKAGQELTYFSIANSEKIGKDYNGTTAYISSDDQQKKQDTNEKGEVKLTPDQIWITTDKNNLNSGFVINKGKIISVKDDIKMSNIKESYDNSYDQKYKAVEIIFNESPGLSKIGSIENYIEYINNIFPNSKVKNIYYRGQESKTDISKNNTQGNKQTGIYFSFLRNNAKFYAKTQTSSGNGVVISVILNIKNLSINPSEDILKDFAMISSKPNDYDGFISESLKEIVVFDINQIHILGTPNDIEGFKNWIKNKDL